MCRLITQICSKASMTQTKKISCNSVTATESNLAELMTRVMYAHLQAHSNKLPQYRKSASRGFAFEVNEGSPHGCRRLLNNIACILEGRSISKLPGKERENERNKQFCSLTILHIVYIYISIPICIHI